MKHSINVCDQQVAEIEANINIFWSGAKKHEMALECKRAIDLRFGNVPEAKRLREAQKDMKSFIDLLDENAKAFNMIEKV